MRSDIVITVPSQNIECKILLNSRLTANPIYLHSKDTIQKALLLVQYLVNRLISIPRGRAGIIF